MYSFNEQDNVFFNLVIQQIKKMIFKNIFCDIFK